MTADTAPGRDPDRDRADAETIERYEEIDPDVIVEDAVDLITAGADEEEPDHDQVAEPVVDGDGPVPNA